MFEHRADVICTVQYLKFLEAKFWPSWLLDGFGRRKPPNGRGQVISRGTESGVRMSEGVARGVVLGPFEALCAEVMWFRESVPIAQAFRGASLVRVAVPRLPRVSWQVQRKILTANLLYGDLDVSAAGPWGANFLDALLMKNGINVSQREWTEEFLPPEIISPLRRFRMNDAFHVDAITRFVPLNTTTTWGRLLRTGAIQRWTVWRDGRRSKRKR
jgi:hypothetical protein